MCRTEGNFIVSTRCKFNTNLLFFLNNFSFFQVYGSYNDIIVCNIIINTPTRSMGGDKVSFQMSKLSAR